MSITAARALLRRIARDRDFRARLAALPDRAARRELVRAEGYDVSAADVRQLAAARKRPGGGGEPGRSPSQGPQHAPPDPDSELTDADLDRVVGGAAQSQTPLQKDITRLEIMGPQTDLRVLHDSPWYQTNEPNITALEEGKGPDQSNHVDESPAKAIELTALGDVKMPGGETASKALNEYEKGETFPENNVAAIDADVKEEGVKIDDQIAKEKEIGEWIGRVGAIQAILTIPRVATAMRKADERSAAEFEAAHTLPPGNDVDAAIGAKFDAHGAGVFRDGSWRETTAEMRTRLANADADGDLRLRMEFAEPQIEDVEGITKTVEGTKTEVTNDRSLLDDKGETGDREALDNLTDGDGNLRLDAQLKEESLENADDLGHDLASPEFQGKVEDLPNVESNVKSDISQDAGSVETDHNASEDDPDIFGGDGDHDGELADGADGETEYFWDFLFDLFLF